MNVDTKKLKLTRRKPRGALRNKPCWCRSGKKFKKCHGFPSSDPGSTGLLPQAGTPNLTGVQA